MLSDAGRGARPDQPTTGSSGERRRRAAVLPSSPLRPHRPHQALTANASSTCCVSTTSLARSTNEAAIDWSSVSEVSASAVSTLSCIHVASQFSAMRHAGRAVRREPARRGAHLRCPQPLHQLRPPHGHRLAAGGRQLPPRGAARRRGRPDVLHGGLHGCTSCCGSAMKVERSHSQPVDRSGGLLPVSQDVGAACLAAAHAPGDGALGHRQAGVREASQQC